MNARTLVDMEEDDDSTDEEDATSAGEKAVPKPKEGPLKLTAEAAKKAAEEEAVAASRTSPLRIKLIASCSLPPACARARCTVSWSNPIV